MSKDKVTLAEFGQGLMSELEYIGRIKQLRLWRCRRCGGLASHHKGEAVPQQCIPCDRWDRRHEEPPVTRGACSPATTSQRSTRGWRRTGQSSWQMNEVVL